MKPCLRKRKQPLVDTLGRSSVHDQLADTVNSTVVAAVAEAMLAVSKEVIAVVSILGTLETALGTALDVVRLRVVRIANGSLQKPCASSKVLTSKTWAGHRWPV